MKTIRIISIAIISCLLLSSCEKDGATTSTPSFPEDFIGIQNIFENQGIGAAVWLNRDVSILINESGDTYAWLENGVVLDVRSTSDGNSIFSHLPFSEISAAVALNSVIYLFDMTGSNYTTLGFNVDNIQGQWNNPDFFNASTTVNELREWGPDDTAPFASIGAAIGWHSDRTCANKIANRTRLFHFEKDASNMVIYRGDGNIFLDEAQIQDYELEDCSNSSKAGLGITSTVEAAFVFPVNGKVYEVFFINGGRDFLYSELGTSVLSETYPVSM